MVPPVWGSPPPSQEQFLERQVTSPHVSSLEAELADTAAWSADEAQRQADTAAEQMKRRLEERATELAQAEALHALVQELDFSLAQLALAQREFFIRLHAAILKRTGERVETGRQTLAQARADAAKLPADGRQYQDWVLAGLRAALNAEHVRYDEQVAAVRRNYPLAVHLLDVMRRLDAAQMEVKAPS